MALPLNALAEVQQSGAGGFVIKSSATTALAPEAVYDTLTQAISRWWDANHTYSGDAANLAIDLKKGWFLERMPDGGFVRHMEVVVHRPARQLRMAGGLGPLQGMGVHGALTFELSQRDGSTVIDLTYSVSGFDGLNLDKIAPAVDRVLSEQLDRLSTHCTQQANSQ